MRRRFAIAWRVIHQGELRGVGAVAELTSEKQGKVEIVFYAQDQNVPRL